MGTATARKEVIEIKNEWCKGCGLCVSFCNKGVLSMNAYGKAVIEKPELCTQCGKCEMYCPDFAIMWRPEDDKKNPIATR
jgi:2-oxoglutarate ferredoxin oxidoreductase subunit delta